MFYIFITVLFGSWGVQNEESVPWGARTDLLIGHAQKTWKFIFKVLKLKFMLYIIMTKIQMSEMSTAQLLNISIAFPFMCIATCSYWICVSCLSWWWWWVTQERYNQHATWSLPVFCKIHLFNCYWPFHFQIT